MFLFCSSSAARLLATSEPFTYTVPSGPRNVNSAIWPNSWMAVSGSKSFSSDFHGNLTMMLPAFSSTVTSRSRIFWASSRVSMTSLAISSSAFVGFSFVPAGSNTASTPPRISMPKRMSRIPLMPPPQPKTARYTKRKITPRAIQIFNFLFFISSLLSFYKYKS